MKDSRNLMEATEVGSRLYEKNLVEEMRELGKLRTAVMVEKCLSKNEAVMCPKPRRTAVMVEKCLSKNEVVMCPKPRRRHMRYHLKKSFLPEWIIYLHFFLDVSLLPSEEWCPYCQAEELDDISASPPCYSVSPPVRASNPLIQDARFREQRISQNSTPGVRLEGFGNVDHTRRTQSIPTMA